METTKTTNETEVQGVLGRLVDETGVPKLPSHCIIQYGGRVRLPDKLKEILDGCFVEETIWWQPDGDCFAFDSETIQEKVLDVWFRGTKLSSFIRSLNRWGFRRVFYHALAESALAFHHPSFSKKSTSEQLKSMKMSKSSGKATGAMAAATTTPSPALPKGLNLTDSSLLRTKTPATVSSQATAMLSLPSFQQITSGTGPATSSSSFFAGQQNLMRNTSNGSASGSNYATHSSQQMLLKLISEQRNRDLLALSSKVQPLLPSLQNALSNSASQQHQLLMLARAKQEWQQQQQQQKEATSALRMALMSMQQKQNSHSNAL